MGFIQKLSDLFKDGDENHDFRRVFDPEDYEAAPSFYVKDKLEGLRSPWNPVNLVRDVAALDTGGELREADEFLTEVEKRYEENYRKVPEEERGIWSSTMGEYVPTLEEYRAFQAAAASFVETVDLDKVCIGDSPVERSINYMASLAKSSSSGARGQGEPQDDNLPQEFSGGSQAGKEMAERMNKAWDKISNMSEQERRDLHAMERDACKNTGGAEKGQPNKGWDYSQHRPQLMVDLVSSVVNHNTIDILDQIARNLDDRIETQVLQEIDFTEVPGGPHMEVRDIEGIHEIPMLAPFEIASMMVAPEYTIDRILHGEAQVMPRGERLTKKQLVVMVCDVSGSMMWGSAPRWRAAIGILRNRLEYASRGKAEAHWAMFATNTGRIKKQPEGDMVSLAELHNAFTDNNLGSGTNIYEAVESAIRYIRKHFNDEEHNSRPEIIVVTDGEAGNGEKIVELWESFERDVGPLRINTFFISKDTSLREIMRKRVDDEIFVRGELGYYALPSLAYVAQESGGGVWCIDPETGKPILPHEFLGQETPERVKHNPWSRGW